MTKGINLFTKRDTFLDKQQIMELFMTFSDSVGNGSIGNNAKTYNLPIPTILKPIPLWTGKQVISALLPEIDYNGFHSTYKKNESDLPLSDDITDTRIQIIDGQLISGRICKKSIGTTSGGILHIIFNDHGPKMALDFLDTTSKIICQWLLFNGITTLLKSVQT